MTVSEARGLKVGDKVRIIESINRYEHYLDIGQIGEVNQVDDEQIEIVGVTDDMCRFSRTVAPEDIERVVEETAPTSKIDWSKPIRTKEGGEAELLGVLKNPAEPGYTHVVRYKNIDGFDEYDTFTSDGIYDAFDPSNGSEWDLENVPEKPVKHVVWMNVYPYQLLSTRVLLTGHISKEVADNNKYPDCRIARLKVEFEEGRFDE